MYSAIKIIAKVPLLYSILNPETNSDSPSAKSNGVRFSSARHEIIHGRVSGRKIINHIVFCSFKNLTIVVEEVNIIRHNKMNLRVISYETICEINRILPIRAYLELDDHPDAIKKNTLIPKIDINRRIEKFIVKIDFKYGIVSHNVILTISLSIGDARKIRKFILFLTVISFVYSLIASENGWNKPFNPTLLGPNRICM